MRNPLSKIAILGTACLAAISSHGQAVATDPTGPGTLFIEAEDFNYTDDDATGGLHVEFGAGDCLLLGKGAIADVDYHEVNTVNDQTVYRGPTGVEAGKLNTDGLLRGGSTISCSYIVGWNDAGDWYNYTRTFPSGGVTKYKVYARLSSGGAAESAELGLIGSDPSLPDQKKFVVGTFNAPPTGNWDIFHSVPLRNRDGQEMVVKLEGLTTIRFTTLPGAFDYNYLAFVPQPDAAQLPPLANVSPRGKVTRRDNVVLRAEIVDQETTVKGDTIKFFVDDMSTPLAGVIPNEDHAALLPGANPEVTIPELEAGDHQARLTFTDSAGNVKSLDWTFEVGPEPFLPGTLFVEAEDFNFTDPEGNAGQFVEFGTPNCSIPGAGATEGIDYNEINDTNDQADYRAPTAVETGKPAADTRERGDTTIECSYILGWNDPGDWYNYTRTFPTGKYKIYGRFASGGLDEHARLELVTSDPTKPDQTVSLLGKFDSEATHNWDVFHFVSLRDGTGKDAIVKLDGLTTLRWTMGEGNIDFNFLAFVPQPNVIVRPTVLSVKPANNTVSLRDPIIAVQIGDRETFVKGTSIRIVVDDQAVAGVEVTENHPADGSGGATATVKLPRLPVDSIHTLEITFDDDATPSVRQTVKSTFTVGPVATDSLFIEAEDFNYTDDTGAAGLHANFGDPDCSLLNKSATAEVDFHEVNMGNDQALYRGPIPVETGKLGADSAERGTGSVSCSYILGWNDPGDWYNYTRDFGPTRRYNIYGRFASGGASEVASFGRVTSDPTQPEQTVVELGQFNSPPTGNWDVFHFVPLKNSQGELASIRLAGTETLRWTMLPGAIDFNYLALVPADIQVVGPSVTSIEPLADSDYARAAKVFAVIKNQDTSVKLDSVKLTFDGVVTPAVATATDDGARIEFQAPTGSAIGTVHTVKVDYQDDQASPASYTKTWSYKEGIYNEELNLFIEAEDFNTDGGNYLPSAGGVPFNAKSLYNGLSAVSDVDFHDAGNPENDLYRIGETPNLGMGDISSDHHIRGAGPRNGFTTTVDYKIGWNAPGEWHNYTREFPAGRYNIYARISSGGADMHSHLDLVSDPTSATPDLTLLGRFDGTTTGGWDTFTFVPLKNDAGELAVVDLAGKQTLRYTIDPGEQDHNYLMLCPAPTEVPTPRFTGITLVDGNKVRLEWTGDAVLEVADDLNGPWVAIPGATSGLVADVDRVKRFARLRAR